MARELTEDRRREVTICFGDRADQQFTQNKGQLLTIERLCRDVASTSLLGEVFRPMVFKEAFRLQRRREFLQNFVWWKNFVWVKKWKWRLGNERKSDADLSWFVGVNEAFSSSNCRSLFCCLKLKFFCWQMVEFEIVNLCLFAEIERGNCVGCKSDEICVCNYRRLIRRRQSLQLSWWLCFVSKIWSLVSCRRLNDDLLCERQLLVVLFCLNERRAAYKMSNLPIVNLTEFSTSSNALNLFLVISRCFELL